MNSDFFFEIPEDSEIMTKLVQAVPSDCGGWIGGQLNAPKFVNLSISEPVEINTGFLLERACVSIKGNNIKPNFLAIMLEQKLPGFISFHGVECSELVKQIIVGFLRKGYRGGLQFYLDGYNKHTKNGPALCEINFEPSGLMLQCADTDSGKSIVATCRSLNLHEYVPAKRALA